LVGKTNLLNDFEDFLVSNRTSAFVPNMYPLRRLGYWGLCGSVVGGLYIRWETNPAIPLSQGLRIIDPWQDHEVDQKHTPGQPGLFYASKAFNQAQRFQA
jgi:hypothetical protein